MSRESRLVLLGAVTGLILAPAAARAGCLNPNNFASLGVLNLAPGDYTIETNGAPVLRDSSNNVLFTGTTFFQGGTFGDTISVLTFSSINIGAGVNIRASGDDPLALLSQSDVMFTGVLDASGFQGADSARFGGSGLGGAGGPGAGRGGNGAGGAGVGPGGGPAGAFGIGAVQAGGGGYGGKGGDSIFGTFGAPYGDLNLFLQGGSGGGATGGSAFDGGNGAGGGGGGGAVEIGAITSITFNGGDLIANGGGVGAAFAANAGGGSGGGLLLHASEINVGIGSVITANGGPFWGGGGRILFLTDTATINQTGGTIQVGVGGGANNPEPGVIGFGVCTDAIVPEPASIVAASIGVCGLLVFTRRRAGRTAARSGTRR